MPKPEISIVIPAEIARDIFTAAGSALPGERIRHTISMIPAGDQYTCQIKTEGILNKKKRVLQAELMLTGCFKVKG